MAKAASNAGASRAADGDPRWTVFLDRLAETSNVLGSAASAKIARSAIYARKRRDPRFARQMLEALVDGYDALEFLLLAKLRLGELQPVGGTTPSGRPKRVRVHDLGAAMRLLALHQETRARFQAELTRRPGEEVRAALEAKLDAIKARRAAARRRKAG